LITAEIETAPSPHDHRQKTPARTALPLIGLIAVMAVVFAVSTIATYVAL
jgi:hypothetical protein